VLTESILVAVAAGVLGLLVSVWGVGLVNRLLPASLEAFAGSGTGWALTGTAVAVTLDWRVLAFATLTTLATGLLFGSIPAHQASDVSAHEVLRQMRTTSGVRARTRKLLVVSQLAIAVVLLVAAGLLLRSVARLQATDPGFDPNGVVTLRTVLSPQAYADAQARRAFFDSVVDRVKRLPGVESAGFVTFLPLTFEGLGGSVAIESRPVPGTTYPISARYRMVTHEYLQALRVPLHAGRRFADTDTAASAKVAVVNEALARALWKDDFTQALGQRVMMFGSPTDTPERWLTVVGIVGSVRQSRLDVAPPLEVYALQAQGSPFTFAEPRDLAVRVNPAIDPLTLGPTLREIVRDIDPEQPVTDVRLLSDVVRQGSAARRTYLWIVGSFAVLTLALGAFGLASVMAYVISARRQELTLRLALGALPRQVMTLIMRECALLVGTGIGIGLVAAVMASRAMRAWLYETAPTDPLTLTIVPITLALVCFAGCVHPVWRATKLDPATGLRVE
jgi:predicted permease